MKNKTVGLDESELNARGDHVSPSDRQRSMKRGSPNFSHGVCQIGFEPPLEPRAYRVPVCPVCGAETDTILRDMDNVIVGCPECIEAVDAWSLEREDFDEV